MAWTFDARVARWLYLVPALKTQSDIHPQVRSDSLQPRVFWEALTCSYWHLPPMTATRKERGKSNVPDFFSTAFE